MTLNQLQHKSMKERNEVSQVMYFLLQYNWYTLVKLALIFKPTQHFPLRFMSSSHVWPSILHLENLFVTYIVSTGLRP